MRPMAAVLREHQSGEVAATTDLASLPASGSAHGVPYATTALASSTRGPRRVLVVDDDEEIRWLIAANLRLEGFDVATAVDGQDCLQKAVAIAPDVITLDVTMPRLDGWETALRLRKCPVTSHIKVLLITASNHEDGRTSQRHADVDACLTKPFDVGEMIRIVRRLADATPAAFM